MDRSLTLRGVTLPRILSFVSALGMIVASAMTIEHYFAANFPETIFEGSFCDLNAFFNCDSSAFSELSQIGGVPLGFFGVIVGARVMLGTLFPSPAFERSNKSISLCSEVEDFRDINVIARKVLSDVAIPDRLNKGIALSLALTCRSNDSQPSQPAGSDHLPVR